MIWLLSSPEIEDISIPFLRNCNGVLDLYLYLIQFYTTTLMLEIFYLKWLRWLGFNFIKVHYDFGYEKGNLLNL